MEKKFMVLKMLLIIWHYLSPNSAGWFKVCSSFPL